MNRLAIAGALLLSAATYGVAQTTVVTPTVADIVWRDVYDSQGNRSSSPVFSRSPYDHTAPAKGSLVSFDGLNPILAVDNLWRKAKLTNDLAAMDRILSDDFFETNQNGNSRDKAQALDLWSTFRISSLIPARATIRVMGDIVTITGEETEVNATGTDRMLFTRIYRSSGQEQWRLLASTQFRNPKSPSPQQR